MSFKDTDFKEKIMPVSDSSKHKLNNKVSSASFPDEQEADIDEVFKKIIDKIQEKNDLPFQVKEDVIAELKDVRSEFIRSKTAHEEVDESYLQRRFRNIARLAPDIVEMIFELLTAKERGASKAIRTLAEIRSSLAGDSSTDAPLPDVKKKRKGNI